MLPSVSGAGSPTATVSLVFALPEVNKRKGRAGREVQVGSLARSRDGQGELEDCKTMALFNNLPKTYSHPPPAIKPTRKKPTDSVSSRMKQKGIKWFLLGSNYPSIH